MSDSCIFVAIAVSLVTALLCATTWKSISRSKPTTTIAYKTVTDHDSYLALYDHDSYLAWSQITS